MMKMRIGAGIGLLLLLPIPVLASFDYDLQYGSNGPKVTELQEFLTAQGNYTGPITGNFYSLTRQGVISFQLAHNISPPAGYFGPLTRAKVNEILDAQNAASDAQAIQETGSVPEPTKDDLISLLQAQVNALLEQLNKLTAQVETQTAIQQQTQNTLQQTQQSVQQIQQNTTPPPPPPPPAPVPQVVKDLILKTGELEKPLTFGGFTEFSITASYTENGKEKPAMIMITSPQKTETRNTAETCGCSSFRATETGTYTITASANGIIKSVDVQVVEYVKVDPNIVSVGVYPAGASEPVETPSYPIGYVNATIANFNLTDADEPYQISQLSFEADVPTSNLDLQAAGSSIGIYPSSAPRNYSSTLYQIKIRNTEGISAGTYTFILKGIKVLGLSSGQLRDVQGFPLTFHFSIQ